MYVCTRVHTYMFPVCALIHPSGISEYGSDSWESRDG